MGMTCAELQKWRASCSPPFTFFVDVRGVFTRSHRWHNQCPKCQPVPTGRDTENPIKDLRIMNIGAEDPSCCSAHSVASLTHTSWMDAKMGHKMLYISIHRAAAEPPRCAACRASDCRQGPVRFTRFSHTLSPHTSHPVTSFESQVKHQKQHTNKISKQPAPIV